MRTCNLHFKDISEAVGSKLENGAEEIFERIEAKNLQNW